MIALAALAFALAGSGASQAEAPGAIAGSYEVRIDGRQTLCRGVYLIPRSAGVDAEVARVFGNLDRGRRYVGLLEMRRRLAAGRGDGSGVAGLREAECPGWPEPHFSFDGVPPGDYYVTAYFSPPLAVRDPSDSFSPRGLDVMRRVRVAPGRAASVSLRN